MSMQEIARRIRAEAQKTHKWEIGLGSQDQERILASWVQMRPRMLAALRKQGVDKLLARLLEERALEQMAGQLALQLSPTDAQEESEKDWYLIEEEERGRPEVDLAAILDRIEAGGRQQ